MRHPAVTVIVIGLVWAVLYYGYWVIIRRRLVMVAPCRVYQSGGMWPGWLLYYVRRYTIKTVIDFRAPHEQGVSRQVRALTDAGVRSVNIPIGALPTQSDLRCFIDVMTEEISAGRRVLMHCKDGQGRAVAMAAIYRIEFEGWSPLQAYRGTTRLPPGFKFVSFVYPSAGLLSPRNCKTQFILEYQPVRGALSTRTAQYASEAGI